MIYAVRHCKAAGQETAAPLTAEGRRQAEALAAFFADKPVDRIVCSPFLRAQESIAPLAARLGLPIHTDARLAELVMVAEGPDPDWQGMMAATFANPALSLNGGETTGAAATRVAAVVDELLGQAGNSIIVTHGYLMTLLLRQYDPAFDLTGWARLTNPDVFLLTDRATRVWQEVRD